MRNLYLTLSVGLLILLTGACKKETAAPEPKPITPTIVTLPDSVAGNYRIHVIESDTSEGHYFYDTSYYQNISITALNQNSIDFSEFDNFVINNIRMDSLVFQINSSSKSCRAFIAPYNGTIAFITVNALLNYYPANDSIYAQYTTQQLSGNLNVTYSGKRIK